MEPLNSKSAEQRLSQLCTQLEACRSVDDVRRTLSELDASVVSGNQAETVLFQLLSANQAERLTELVLTSGSWTQPLSDWLLGTFPTTIDEYLFSIHHKVVEKLSLFLTLLPHPFEQELVHLLRQYRIRVELAPQVMSGLMLSSFEEPNCSAMSPVELEEFELHGFVIGKKMKQSDRKQAQKAKRQAWSFKPRDFQRLGVEEPHSMLEAYTTAQLLLNKMQQVLEEYISLLRHPDVTSNAHRMFVVEAPSTSPSYTGKCEYGNNTTGSHDQVAPSGYPCVPLMKAALYFENAQGFGKWRILVSTSAERGLRQARRKDRHIFQDCINKIKELSYGNFSTENQKQLNGTDLEVPVYEARVAGDTRLVYQIDCIPEYDAGTETQEYSEFIPERKSANSSGALWDANSLGKGRNTAGVVQLGSAPNLATTSFSLGAFLGNNEARRPMNYFLNYQRTLKRRIHSLLVLEKFVTLSKELWISILADLDVSHVFEVTPQEKEIIEYPFSCYVLGRSGTGKTTTMLFKMLGIERAYTQQFAGNSDMAKPRQLFVTHSRMLTTRVEEYFSKLLESLATAKKSNKEIKALAEKKKLLQDSRRSLFDLEDDVTWKASLPEKFSLLQDEHFPLFLTFEKLAQLLEADTGTPAFNKPDKTGKRQLINYDIFLKRYWSHFPQDMIKTLDPALVFSELLGVIEGSEESLSHETRYLDRNSYLDLSHRAQHVFAKQRDRLYDIFEVYKRHKRQHGDSDAAERTHCILSAFEDAGVPGNKVDYIYVDEAQDNLLVDAMLLRSLCRNPNGLFWAGDTAQTIAIGSSFRFNDLKAFLYRLELRREEKLKEDGVTRTEIRTFQLATNYRSHGGIVRCATAVVELITHFWPYAIDSLAPERGVVDGAKPVFFGGWDTDTVRYEQFLSDDSGERLQFGARQCILVRDKAALTELRQRFGDVGTIMTPYDSKGLEFDDVLLYKFFEDSKVELSQWRVILNMLDSSQRQGVAAPRFDEGRHTGVCSELKFLYVAVTRSRKNLWIIDYSDKAKPMKMLWESKGFIELHTPGSNVPRLAVESSPEEWASTGQDLFTHRQYLEAMGAFKRAGMDHEAMVAHTHHIRETARLILPTTKDGVLARRRTFQSAAQSFLECAEASPGKETSRVNRHNAGDCFEQAGDCGEFFEDYRCAAKAYEEALEYNSAVKLYQKTNMFDEAVGIVREHRRKMDVKLVESVLEMARLFYFRCKDYKKAKSLFESDQEQLEYFEDNILLDECHADVLVEQGKYQEAADIHVEEGRTMKAIQVLLSDKSQESTQRANNHILQGLWQHTSFSMTIKDSDTIAVELLLLASQVNYDLLSPTQKDEIAMFRNLRTTANNGTYFRDIGYEFLKRDEKAQALLCLDHFFFNLSFTTLAHSPSSDICPLLENFLDYCRLFREVVRSLDLADEGSRKLFNFRPASIENAYRVPANTWLHGQIIGAKTGVLEIDDGGLVVASADLLQTLRTSLLQRLSERLFDQNYLCRRLQLWTPCLPHVVNGICHRQGCSRQHLHRKELTQGWFNDQLRGVFLQIMVYQVYHSIPIPKKPELLSPDSRRYWIHKLYETMRPTAHYLGSQACLRLEDISAQAVPALNIVNRWCLDILHTRAAGKDRMMLSFLYEAAALCLTFDRSKATRYLPQAPLLRIFEDLHYYYRLLGSTGNKVYIVPELYQCLQATDVNFITAGILFIQQVVLRKITIDLNVLSHLFEFIAGSLILARLRFNLHMVTLPRGWFLQLLQQIQVREADTILLDRLVISLSQLLHDLVLGGDGARYLLFEGRDRDFFISRVCRALGLIGCNLINQVLRREILRAFKILDTAKPHRTFRRFIGRHSWRGVALAAESSYSESQLDDLVQLCSTDTQYRQLEGPPDGVRRVFFKSLEHALVVLANGPMRADAPDFVPRAERGAETSSGAGEERGEAAELDIDRPEADTTELVDSHNLEESLVSTATPLAPESITEEQKSSARALLALYRCLLRAREMEKAKTQTQKSCDSFYLTYLKSSQGMDWGEVTFYKKLYLGLIPHLLTCVDVVQPYAQSAKKKLRPRLLNESERDLEGLKKEMDDLSAILKSSTHIQKQLDPSSSLHKERNVEKLKQLVGEVQELLKCVPPAHGLAVQFHLDIAIKGIVTEKKVPKPSPKPELNVDDLNDIYV